MPEIISPAFELLDINLVKMYQAEGFKIIPWTVNEIQNMQSLMAMGVDGIITDFPDKLIALSTSN